MTIPVSYPPGVEQTKHGFEGSAQGSYVIRSWEWLVWAYRHAIPNQITTLHHQQRRHIKG